MGPNLRTFVVTVLWIIFVLTCAGIIQYLEDTEDRNLRQEFSTAFEKFLAEVNGAHQPGAAPPGAPQPGVCLSSDKLMEFVKSIELPITRGYLANTRFSFLNATFPGARPIYTWDFDNSLFFICALVTTVGYGNIVPLSDSGKGFSVAVVVVGVPFTILLFSVWIERLLHLTDGWRKGGYVALRRRGMSAVASKATILSIIFVVAVVVLVVVPALLIHACETDWSILTTIYYCVLTLATAGLGDFVPTKGSTCYDVVIIVVAVYIVNGVMLTMFVLANFFEVFEMGGVDDDDDDDDDERKPLKSGDEAAAAAAEPAAVQCETPEDSTLKAKIHDFYLTVLGR